MKKSVALFMQLAVMFVVLPLSTETASAQGFGPSDDMIRENFMTILQKVDANKDGKLSMKECMAIWKDSAKGEKNCKYWDADSDGTITEDEYIKQARKTMK